VLRTTLKPIPNFENYAIDETGTVINLKTGKVVKPSLNENGYLYVSLWKDNKGSTRAVHRLVAQTFIPNWLDKPFVNHKDANRANPHKNNLEWCTQSENIKHAYNIGNRSQKRHFTPEELDWLLIEFLQNKNMTGLAQTMGVGLSRLTINLRNRATKTGKGAAFEDMLKEQKRTRNTQANAGKQRPVVQLDEAGAIIATYPSATAAARALGKSTSGPISNCLNPHNPQKIGYGYQWKYV
jgi:hypothetical protein